MKQPSNPLTLVRLTAGLAVCASFVLAAGCGEQRTTVKGLVTLDGKPLEIHKGMRGTVVFQPTAADGNTLNGMIDGQGRYELAVGSNLAVTPSAYWVTVSALELVPASEERPQASGRRITPAKYASATDSGFRVEVKPGENQVDLALKSDAESPAAVAAPEQGEEGGEPSAEVQPAVSE